MEERGLSRGGQSNHSVTPAAESSKKFKDVVGVDEVTCSLFRGLCGLVCQGSLWLCFSGSVA
eukprot:3133187-Rhodomonas_salina.1